MQPTMDSVWALLISLFPIEVTYGLIPAKTITRNAHPVLYWGQVSVGTEYQVILCINRECSGEVVGVSLE